MNRLHTFESFVNELTSGEAFNPKRNTPIKFDPKRYPELAGEFYELIATAYAEIGGHIKIKSPSNVFADPDWDYWEGIDIHGTNDFDIVFFGSKTRYGVKFSGVGHDGSKDAKRAYLDMRGKDLKNFGYYIEVSDKVAEILMNKYNVPQVTDPNEVEKVLGTVVNWIGKKQGSVGEGWYSRKIAGSEKEKIMLGRPKV